MFKIPRFLLLVILFSFVCVSALEADQLERILENSPRPANSMFDPTGVLTPKQHAEITGPLLTILKDEGIDIVLVILPEIGEIPPDHVARSFAKKWSKSGKGSVVLHVPGREGTPWIFLGEEVGEEVKPEVLRESVSEGEKRAAAESDDFNKVRAASVEAADAVRYWAGGAVLRSEAIINARLMRQLDFERKTRLLKLAALMGAAALIPVIVGLAVLFSRLKKMGPRVFPAIRKIPRLGAPYSGGNRIVSGS